MERNLPSGRPPWKPPSTAARVFGAIGIALVAVLCLGALFYVAAAVVLIIGLNQMGSNK